MTETMPPTPTAVVADRDTDPRSDERTLEQWLAQEGRRLVAGHATNDAYQKLHGDDLLTRSEYTSTLINGSFASEPIPAAMRSDAAVDLTVAERTPDVSDVVTFDPPPPVPVEQPAQSLAAWLAAEGWEAAGWEIDDTSAGETLLTPSQFRQAVVSQKLRLVPVEGTSPQPLAADRPSTSITADAVGRFRITMTGDDAPTVYELTGVTWGEVVDACTAESYEQPYDETSVKEVRGWLENGLDGEPGWNGKSVTVHFQECSMTVEAVTSPVGELPAQPAVAEDDPSPVAGDTSRDVQTETRRTVNEWAALDKVEFVNTEGFENEIDLAHSLFTKDEYLTGKNGSLFKPAVKPEPAPAKPDATPPRSPRLRREDKGPTAVDGDTLRRLEDAIEKWQELNDEWESLKKDAAKKKKELDETDALIRSLAGELRSPQPSLFDDASPPALLNPIASVGSSESPPDSGTAAVVLPAAADDRPGRPAIPDEAWRPIPMKDLPGMTPAVLKALDEKFGAAHPDGIATIGAVDDYCKMPNQRLSDIPGIGEKTGDKIGDAMNRLWAKLGADQAAADSSMPAKADDAPTPEEPALVWPAAAADEPKEKTEALDKLRVYVDQRFQFLMSQPSDYTSELANVMNRAVLLIAAGGNDDADITEYLASRDADGIDTMRGCCNRLPDAVWLSAIRNKGDIAAVRADIESVKAQGTDLLAGVAKPEPAVDPLDGTSIEEGVGSDATADAADVADPATGDIDTGKA